MYEIVLSHRQSYFSIYRDKKITRTIVRVCASALVEQLFLKTLDLKIR